MSSDYILSTNTGLITGLLTFYALSLIEVHLRGFLQKEISRSQWNSEKPFEGYLKFLLKDIFGSLQLHIFTLRYLTPFLKISFPSIGIRKIDFWVTFLNSLRIFFLPFVVCGCIFLFVSFEIKGYLPFDLTNTFYAVIQNNLVRLNENRVLNIIYEYKNFMYFFLGILFIVIPFLFLYRNHLKVSLKRFNQILIYIAILTNITFFSGVAASEHHNVNQELADVSLKIKEVHNRIYNKGSALIVYDYIDDVEKNYSEYNLTLEELQSYVIANRFSLADELLGEELEESLNKLIDSSRTSMVDFQRPILKINRIDPSYSFETIRKHFNAKSNSSGPIHYVFNQEKWTYNKGLTVEATLDKHIAEVQAKAKKKFSGSKGYLITEEIFSLLASSGIGVVTDLLSESVGEIAKALLKSLSKASKNQIVERINLSLKGLYPKTPKKISINRNSLKNIKKEYNSVNEKYQKQDDELTRQVHILEEQLKNRMQNELANQVISDLKNIDYQNIELGVTSTKDNKKILLENTSELKRLVEEALKDKKRTRAKIITTYGNLLFAKGIFQIPELNKRRRKEYINSLKKLNAREALKSKKPFYSKSGLSKVIICPCCFQNMNHVKVCVPINPICF